MAVHVVLNQKGGVGKSTIAVNLAAVTADVLNHSDDPDASSPVAADLRRPAGLGDLVGVAHQRSALPHRAGPRRPRRPGAAEGPARHPARLRRHPGLDRPRRRRRRLRPAGQGPRRRRAARGARRRRPSHRADRDRAAELRPDRAHHQQGPRAPRRPLPRGDQQLGPPRRHRTTSTRPRSSSRPTAGRWPTP